MKKNDRIRLVLAMVISPMVPILAISGTYWMETGSRVWFPVFAVFGYLFFALIGLPVAGALIHKKRVLSCAVAGGVTSIAPILLLSVFSIFSGNKIFTLEVMGNLALLFLVGCVGGMLFWLIAFSGNPRTGVSS